MILGVVLVTYTVTGDPAFADAELRHAASRYARIAFPAGLPEVWRVQAGVARARGEVKDAVTLLTDAAHLAAEHGSTDTLADIERDLSAALDARGDEAGARAARERAVALYQKIGALAAARRLSQR